jgi:RES domain-containing protein
MILWRLSRAAYRDLDGEGARLYGGRWNSEGVAVVYLSRSLSLAALEYLVHINVEDVPSDLLALEVEVPDDVAVEEIDPGALPEDWFKVPDHPACVELGDDWVRRGTALLLSVPSAIIRSEEIVLLNTDLPEAAEVRVINATKFSYDPRLLP